MASSTVNSIDEVDLMTLAEIAESCKLPVESIQDVYSCTPTQLSMIAETRNEVFDFIVSFGPTADIDLFCEALRKVARVNPIYRTRIVNCSLGIVQVVTIEDHISQRLSGDVDEYLCDGELHHMTFGTPLFRSAFVDTTFVATIHHAVMDHWSWTTFLDEDVARVYYGNPPRIRPPFKDFVRYRTTIDESMAVSFWRTRFHGDPAIFPKVEPAYYSCARTKEPWKINLAWNSNAIPTSHIPHYIEAAWALTSSIYTDCDSVAYGFVMSGRTPKLGGVEAALGPAVVEVPVQVNLKRSMTVQQLIKDRAISLRNLQTNPALQYDSHKIREVSDSARIASEFQTLLNIRPVLHTRVHEESEIGFSRIVCKRGFFPLQFVCVPLDDGILVEPRADPKIVPDKQFDRILRQFDHSLQVLTTASQKSQLHELDLVSPEDRSQILSWNRKTHLIKAMPLHEAFMAQAQLHPEKMAVDATDGMASYFELNEMSDRLANALRRRGVLRGHSVALIAEKSLAAILAMISILKVGGVCVLIDRNDQHTHKSSIVTSTGANLILASSAEFAYGLGKDVLAMSVESIARLPKAHRLHSYEKSSAEDIAFILFTGGSTGAPKGVILEHVSLVSSLTSLAQLFGWQPDLRMLQFASPISNISISEIFGALMFGGCVCVPHDDINELTLPKVIRSDNVNFALLAPEILRKLSPDSVHGLKIIVSIGEPLDAETVMTWGAALQLFNSWGACETSGLSIVADVTSEPSKPGFIGISVGCSAWIVNPRDFNHLSPIGGVGELVIEGPNIARGYLNENVKTAFSFIPPPKWALDPVGIESRFYRTGDLVRYDDNGDIIYVGRQTNRLKIGTQIVQLEEIEDVLRCCIEVSNVITSAKIAMGRTQLVAVVCFASLESSRGAVLRRLTDAHTNKLLASIRAYALSKLRSYKVPTIWVAVEQLPRTKSQKLDRIAVRDWLKTLRK